MCNVCGRKERDSLNTGQIHKVLIFTDGCTQYAMDIAHLQSIIDVPEVAKVPGVSDNIEGIINYRGKVVTLFTLSNKTRKNNGKILLISSEKSDAGILVDQVKEVIDIDINSFQSINGISKEECNCDASLISSAVIINERIVFNIDIHAMLNVFNANKMSEFDEKDEYFET